METYETRVKVPCRISYARINDAYESRNGRERYSLVCLIPKTDTETIENINHAVSEAFRKGLAVKWNDAAPDNTSMPIHDGDEERAGDEAYAGMLFINASNSVRPELVDRNVEEITDRSRVYSGCYCNVMLDMYPFKSETASGIAAELGNIQLVKEGVPLSTRRTAKDDFKVLD